MMSTNTHIPRDIAAKYGHQTVQIIEAGHYTSPSGQVIQIGDKIATSVAGTRSYPPEQTLPQSIRGTHHTEIVVHNETTLAAAVTTSPAVYASRVHSSERTNIASAMWERILKVLSAGLTHGHDAIVLGAWGCGAFGNDGHEIAALFRKALTENFNGAYRRVIFGIVDWSAEKTFIGPFEAAFSNLS